MKCPTDDSPLVITDRSGIEIDVCPRCRGVWLDRGELDKIIERAAAESRRAEPSYRAGQAPPSYRHERRGYDHDDDDDWDRSTGRPKRRRGLLGDLFDF